MKIVFDDFICVKQITLKLTWLFENYDFRTPRDIFLTLKISSVSSIALRRW